jgi:hypothetical protein
MNSTVRQMNSLLPVTFNKPVNAMFNAPPVTANAAPNAGPKLGTPLMWFIGFFVIFLIIFAFYYDAFMRSIQNWTDSINTWLTGTGSPPSDPPQTMQTATPVAPQDENDERSTGMKRVVERVLPPAKEVFTVSKNDYSFYDAAPLCKALGAELATYDEVKKAWQNGADWCNYGWVKGQMAVYPTQDSTYEELQQGPEEQRGVCGKPGLNGGYFDNPELKFGVTCVGNRPSQSQHDATAISAGSTRPLTASGIQFEKKVQQFKLESDNLGILPFNKEKWGS